MLLHWWIYRVSSQPSGSVNLKSAKKRHEIITYYNKTKRRVDFQDKATRIYSCKKNKPIKKTKKYDMCLLERIWN